MSQPIELYSAGKAPKVISEQAVAFYHPTTGQIRHMHRAITLEGAKAADAETVKREAARQAGQLGISLDGLKALHLPGHSEASARFRVDPKTEKLVRLELSPQLRIFRGKR